MFQRFFATFLAATLLFSPRAEAGVLTGAGASAQTVDFVFIIDASPSMSNNITAVKNGMGSFVTDLDAAGVDARFAIVLFGATGPELILDLTSDATATINRLDEINTGGGLEGVHDNHSGNPEDSLTAIRAALNATVTPLNHVHVGGTGRLSFREGALINLILLTDENSDHAFYTADRLPGQIGTSPPTMDANFYGTDWQVEVDNTARAVIEAGAFLNMLVPQCTACPLQYGDPDADVSLPDLSEWDEDITLARLTDGPGDTDPTASRAERSLQAQVIDGNNDGEAGNLVARTFLISKLESEPGFVSNFFAAKIAETLMAICGDGLTEDEEDCDDGNTANGDCCSESCEFEPVDTACTSDSNACTEDVCNATGTCLHDAITCASDSDPCTSDTCDSVAGCNYPDASDGTVCNDGLFCTATDTCTGGVCGGEGSPCGSTECQTVCNEGNDTCAEPMGAACTADVNVCTDDVCNGSGACVHPNNTAPCEDGNECTAGDTCAGGVCITGGGLSDCDDLDDCTIDTCPVDTCQHENIEFFSACFGVLIAGDGDKTGKGRMYAGSQALGNACADLGDIGQTTLTDGNWYILADSGAKAGKIRGNTAVVNGDIATGGGGLAAAPKALTSDLFGTGLGAIPTETVLPKTPTGFVDTTADHIGVPRCLAAQQNQVAVEALLDALPGDQSLGKLQTAANTVLNLAATNVGGITVIDIDRWLIGNFVTINVDGGGSTDSVIVVRVKKKLDGDAGVQWNFVNGAAPERTIFFVQGGKLEIGINNVGGGILFAPSGKAVIKAGSTWTGALLGGKSAELGLNVVLNHAFYTGPNF